MGRQPRRLLSHHPPLDSQRLGVLGSAHPHKRRTPRQQFQHSPFSRPAPRTQQECERRCALSAVLFRRSGVGSRVQCLYERTHRHGAFHSRPVAHDGALHQFRTSAHDGARSRSQSRRDALVLPLRQRHLAGFARPPAHLPQLESPQPHLRPAHPEHSLPHGQFRRRTAPRQSLRAAKTRACCSMPRMCTAIRTTSRWALISKS